MDVKYKAQLDTSNFDAGSNKMKKEISSMDGMFGKMVGAMAAVNIGGKIGSGIMNFGRGAIEQLKNYEYFSTSLRTMMHGDAAGAHALNDELVKLAKETPFSLTDVQTGTKNLMAYGFQANQIVDNLKMIGNVSSGVGAPLNDIIYLYGTLRSSGRVTLMDLRQFAGRGIPIYETLAKVMHKNVSEIGALATAGKVGFKDIENAFKEMTGPAGQFFNLMEAQSKTLGGKLSNLGDALEQFQLEVAKSQSGLLTTLTTWATDFLGYMQQAYALTNRAEENINRGRKGREAYTNMADIQKEKDDAAEIREMALLRFQPGESWRLNKEGYQKFLDQEIKDFGKGDLSSKDNLNSLIKELEREKGSLQSSEMSARLNKQVKYADTFINRIDQVNGALGYYKDLLNSVNKTAANPNNEAAKADEGAAALPTEFRGNKPQTINININEVNGIKTATINSAIQTIEQAKENLAAALLEVVSDIYKITNTQ